MPKLKLHWYNYDKLCLVIDAKYLAHRCKYSPGYSELSYKDKKTGMYFGFFSTIYSLVSKFNPDNIVFMWDTGKTKDSRRREQFSGYKNKKFTSKSDEEIAMSVEFEEEYLGLMSECASIGFANFNLDRYEADDLIALYCAQCHTKVVIITRDEDMYQLLNNCVSIFSPDDKLLKTNKWFLNKYGIPPSDWVKVKQIGGCKSDTVPGVPGIGEKTALQYILGETSEGTKNKIENDSMLDVYYSLVKLPHKDLTSMILKKKTTVVNWENFTSMCISMGHRKFLSSLSEWKRLFSFTEE